MKSIRRPRDFVAIVFLLVALAGLTITAALQETRPAQTIPLDSTSSAPDGARGLFLWLEELGFRPDNSTGRTFAIPEGAAAVFLLEPGFTSPVTDNDVDHLREWVAAGGTLVYASDNPGFNPLAEQFGFETFYLQQPVQNLAPALPLFTNPPLTELLPMTADAYFKPLDADFIPLVAIPEGPVVVASPIGDGWVILSAGTDMFSNLGLKSAGSAEFILNLVGNVPEGAPIWFDEWHHGKREQVLEPGGPGAWLRTTPSGRSALFTALVVFAWIAISGRPFGRPVPVKRERSRRAPLEFVSAIANLNMLAGNRADLLAHYHLAYKRRLARRYRIDVAQADEAFLAALEKAAPELPIDKIAQRLKGLSETNISEAEMIQRISESLSQPISESARQSNRR